MFLISDRSLACIPMSANSQTIGTVLTAILVSMGLMMSIPAMAQTGSAQGSTETQIEYMTEYPRIEAEGDSEVTVQTEYHLYRPGDTVRVTGSVSEEMRQETESDTVTVQLMSQGGAEVGQQQVTVDGDGEYSADIALASNAEVGEYSAGSKIEVQANLLGLLSADIVAKLESPKASFVVGAESSHEIEAEGGETFNIEIASNSNIGDVELREEAKMLSFTVEGETGTSGVTEVTVPKAMLSGEMTVLIDGRVVSSSSSDVIVKSETNADVTFEINYSHSEHTVEITGTNVVPEFPIAATAIAASIGAVIVMVSRLRIRQQWSGP